MPYKIPNLPGSKSHKEEKADFWEVQAVCNPGMYISQTQISRIISTELDEIHHEGIESEDDEVEENLDDVFLELQRRTESSANKYPFDFQRYSMKINENPSFLKEIYLFLLLCTRFNMNTQKTHNEIDATLLFEKLCAHVARNFLGASANSFVFGTANPGNFEDKVNDLINKVGEGRAFQNPNNNTPTKQDDSLDVVVWKEFADKRIGKLIGFGQCKTGTSWRDEIHRLNPGDFCKKWFNQHPVYDPLRMVFICDTLNEDFNFYDVQVGFLFFNRFRILEYVSENLEDEIKQDITTWLGGALESLNIRE